MNNCETKKIPDLLWFQEGPGVRNTQYTSSGVKLLNVANLVNGKVDLSTSDRYISEEEAYGKYKHFLVDDGDFIIASSGIKVDYFDKKMGFVSTSQLPLCMNTSTIRFKVIDKSILDIRYFMYYLKSDHFKRQLSYNITGSAQLNFGPSHIKKMTLPLVCLNKQLIIIERLDKTNVIIDKLNNLLILLDELIKSRFVEMFGDPVLNTKMWEIQPVINECECLVPGRDKPKSFTGSIPWITIDDLIVNGITYSSKQGLGLTKEEIKQVNRKTIPVGSVIMSCVGNLGICSIAGTDMIINQQLHSFQCGNRINRIFLMYNLTYRKDYMNKWASNTTVQYMNKTICNSIPIMLPPIELQNQFADFVAKVEQQKATIQKSIDKLETLRKSLMQEYFGA